MESPRMSDGSFQPMGGSPELPVILWSPESAVKAPDLGPMDVAAVGVPPIEDVFEYHETRARVAVEADIDEMFSDHEDSEVEPLPTPVTLEPVFPDTINDGPREAERRIARSPRLEKLIEWRRSGNYEYSEDETDDEILATPEPVSPPKRVLLQFDWGYSDDELVIEEPEEDPEEDPRREIFRKDYLEYLALQGSNDYYGQRPSPSKGMVFRDPELELFRRKLVAEEEAQNHPSREVSGQSLDPVMSDKAVLKHESLNWFRRAIKWGRAGNRSKSKLGRDVQGSHEDELFDRRSRRLAQKAQAARQQKAAAKAVRTGRLPVSKRQLRVKASEHLGKPAFPRSLEIVDGRIERDIDRQGDQASSEEPDTVSQVAA